MINTFLEKIIGKDSSDEIRLFNVVALLSCFFSLIFALIGIIIDDSRSIILFSLALFLLWIFAYFINKRIKKPVIITLIFLIITQIILYPYALVSSSKNYIEIPIYYILGFVISFVILSGKTRVFMIIILSLVDISTIVYTFYIRKPYSLYYSTLNNIDFLRIEYAIISTGVFCGLVLAYRNRIVFMEMDARKQMGEQAELTNYAKNMFLVNVSHEIRTPLNAIIGTTDMLLDSDCSNHLKEMAFNVSNSSHALLAITSDLLDFSRTNFDSVSMVNESYDISLLLKDVINLMVVRLLDSDVSFNVDIDPSLPRKLLGDEGKLRQILVNILSNAIKYTKKGQIDFNIEIEHLDDKHIKMLFAVCDTGIGIKEENLEKIFLPYNRSGIASTDLSIEGNGLGLAFCKKLLNAMNGKLYVESEYSKGSKFFVELIQEVDIDNYEGVCGEVNKGINTRITVYDSDAKETQDLKYVLAKMNIECNCITDKNQFLICLQDMNSDFYIMRQKDYEALKSSLISLTLDWEKVVVISECNYSYSGEPFEYVLTMPVNCLNVSDLINERRSFFVRKQDYEGSFSLKRASILVIDDNLVNLDVAYNMLSKYDCRVLTAASGKEGLICLEQENIDLVFIDYMMPDMDGIDTLKEIRRRITGKNANVPAIMLTANVVSGAREMFLAAGFDDYLPKPLEADKLSKILLEHIPSRLIDYSIK